MKKTVCILLAFLTLMALANVAFAVEKIVQLTVPGCFS